MTYERVAESNPFDKHMEENSDPRIRTVRWQDPAQFEGPIRKLNGIEFMRAFLTGELPPPPFMQLLGIRIASVEPSSVVFEFDPAEYMYSPLGNVHGGIITVLLDSAMGCSFHTTLPAGRGYTTLELKVNFLKSVTADVGTLRAEGHVIHSGSRVASTEARLLDSRQRLYAHGTSTLLILSAESK
ncbi:MAG: PaaI family thioesterase [Thermoplasmata archaeon]